MFKTIKRVGILGSYRLARDLFFSRIAYPGVRLIRMPWYIRGARYIRFGDQFTSGVGLRVDAFGEGRDQIVFGSSVQVGDYVHIAALQSVIIEDNVLMASKVYISDHDHGTYRGLGPQVTLPTHIQLEKPLQVNPVLIKKNVWLGEGVCILKGVTIGENSIIGALSVVTKSIPPNCIAIGSPARVIKRFDFSLQGWVTVSE